MSHEDKRNPEFLHGKWITIDEFRKLKVGDIVTIPTSKRDWENHVEIPGLQRCKIREIYYDNVGNGCINANILAHAYEPDIERFEECTGYTSFIYSPKLLNNSQISTEVPSTLLIRRVLMLAEKFRSEHSNDLSLTIQEHWND